MKHEINIYNTKKTWDTFKVLSKHSTRGTGENNILQVLQFTPKFPNASLMCYLLHAKQHDMLHKMWPPFFFSR